LELPSRKNRGSLANQTCRFARLLLIRRDRKRLGFRQKRVCRPLVFAAIARVTGRIARPRRRQDEFAFCCHGRLMVIVPPFLVGVFSWFRFCHHASTSPKIRRQQVAQSGVDDATGNDSPGSRGRFTTRVRDLLARGGDRKCSPNSTRIGLMTLKFVSRAYGIVTEGGFPARFCHGLCAALPARVDRQRIGEPRSVSGAWGRAHSPDERSFSEAAPYHKGSPRRGT
jgi:hypothetical protein